MTHIQSAKLVLVVVILLVTAAGVSAASLEDQVCQAIKKNNRPLVKELVAKGAKTDVAFLESRLPMCTKNIRKWERELGKIIVEVASANIEAEVKHKAQRASESAKPAPPGRTLDLSVDQVMSHLSHLFVSERIGEPIDGLENRTGNSRDGRIQYQILGKRWDITSASLQVAIPTHLTNTQTKLIMATFMRFLLNTVPAWDKDEIIRWIPDSMNAMLDHVKFLPAADGLIPVSDHVITKTVGDRRVKMSLPFMFLIVTVEPR